MDKHLHVAQDIIEDTLDRWSASKIPSEQASAAAASYALETRLREIDETLCRLTDAVTDVANTLAKVYKYGLNKE